MGLAPLPEELFTGSFTSATAAAFGVSRKRQRQPDVVIPSRGVRIPLDCCAGVPANLRAYTALDDTSVLTHHSGGRMWELGLPPWLQEDWRIHVAREREGSRPRRRNVVGHRMTFQPGEVVVHDGVRVTSPARTWLDLANLLTVDEIRVGTDSPQETKMRLALARTGLGEPALNYVIRNGWGQPAVWPDAAYIQHRLALQYDGAHHSDTRQVRLDNRRRAVTERLGWTEVRVSRRTSRETNPSSSSW